MRASDNRDVGIDSEFVDAALRAAEKSGKDVADVSVMAIAQEAGVSRSTLLRRLGGSRAALDHAVRASGIDPGGLPPVSVRAVDAAAALIAESGLAAATLEAVAARAGCALYSLHQVFGGRGGLLRAVFERHSHMHDIEVFLESPEGSFSDIVSGLYRTIAQALCREPRVAPAIYAEVFARPKHPAVQTLIHYTAPRMLGVLGRWFEAEIRAGRMLDLPTPLLTQQLLGPILIHMFMRPVAQNALSLPDMDIVCDAFAANFVRAVGISKSEHRP